MPRSRQSLRRSRLLAGTAAVVVIAAAAASAVLLTNRPAAAPGPTTTTTTAPPTTTSSPKPVTAIGTYSVATTSLTVTVAGLAPTDDRLPTTVWYPVTKPAPAHRRARHGYPLLVFSQGYAQPVVNYSALIVDWASAGFVVAGPTYPHTSPSTPTTLDRAPAELVRHPGDLRAVITTLIGAGRTPGSALSGKIDASEVGLVGQSDGGDVSLAVADNSCCRYAGVKAAAILSGAEYRYFGGQYFTSAAPAGPPLLVVQGTSDTINPPVCSVHIYDAAAPPKYYLDLLGGTHLGPYEDATSWEAVVATVTTDFFDAELAGEPAALGRMATSGNVASVAQLTTAPTVPPAAGSCPTGPTAPPTPPSTAPTTTPTSTTATSTTATSTTTPTATATTATTSSPATTTGTSPGATAPTPTPATPPSSSP